MQCALNVFTNRHNLQSGKSRFVKSRNGRAYQRHCRIQYVRFVKSYNVKTACFFNETRRGIEIKSELGALLKNTNHLFIYSFI